MRTFSPHPSHLRGHRPRAVVVAVGDTTGIDDAVDLLTSLPPLACPVVVCAAAPVVDPLVGRHDPYALRECEAGLELSAAPLWVTPGEHLVGVHQDRWELTPHPAVDHATQVGRLCSSLKASYRSRVFIVSTGPTLEDNPFIRLIVQRGAPLVDTTDHPDRTLADHATVADIVVHLHASVGTITKASA